MNWGRLGLPKKSQSRFVPEQAKKKEKKKREKKKRKLKKRNQEEEGSNEKKEKNYLRTASHKFIYILERERETETERETERGFSGLVVMGSTELNRYFLHRLKCH